MKVLRVIPRVDCRGTHVIDRWRMCPLVRRGRDCGYNSGWFGCSSETAEIVVAPLDRLTPETVAKLKANGSRVVGDVTDYRFSFPWSRLGIPGRVAHWIRRKCSGELRRLRVTLAALDGLIVGSQAQADAYRAFVKRVATVTDSIETPKGRRGVPDLSREDVLRIMWIGNVESLHGLRGVVDALNALGRRISVELSIITAVDRSLPLWWKKPRNVKDITKKLRIPYKLIRWSVDTAFCNLAQGHIGIVPVDANEPFMRVKPAGRALLMMAAGLPVVFSDVPSHREISESYGLGLLANNVEQWIGEIDRLYRDKELYEDQSIRGLDVVNLCFSERVFVNKYFSVLDDWFYA